MGLKLHDQLSTLLKGSLISAALLVLAVLRGPHLSDLGLPLLSLLGELVQFYFFLRSSFFQFSQLALQLLTLILFRVELGLGLVQGVL